MNHTTVLALVAVLTSACHATVAAPKPKMPTASRLTPKADPGRPQLAVSPAQTLTPKGMEKLASRLLEKGHWAGTSQPNRDDIAIALKGFQKENKLAATGYPDTETLTRLGLTPDDL